MRLSDERIKSLQALLKDIGLNYTDEQAQDAGMAIMRFTLVKFQRTYSINNENEVKDETNATETR
jgi:hypothetical protein